jgi:co-chaperonin GroES (HSP10)
VTKQGEGVSLSDLGARDTPLVRSRIAFESIDEAFPQVDPGHGVFGDRLLVQLRVTKDGAKTKGGIHLLRETIETENDNTQIAKVIALGPVAFKNRDTLEPWGEGSWAKVGDFVRAPKYGGDRFQVPVPGRHGEYAVFAYFKDGDLLGPITGDPLEIIAYI